jgi:hypothetical protein
MATGSELTIRLHADATDTLVFDSLVAAAFEYDATYNDLTAVPGYYFPNSTTVNPAFTGFLNVVTTNTGNNVVGEGAKRCSVKIEDYSGTHFDAYDVKIAYTASVIPPTSTTLATLISAAEEAIAAVIAGDLVGGPSVNPTPAGPSVL